MAWRQRGAKPLPKPNADLPIGLLWNLDQNTKVSIGKCRLFRLAIFVRAIIWRHMVAACGIYNWVNNGSVDGLLPDGTFHHTSQWRHNERNGVSNHRRLNCFLSRLFRHKSNKTSKLRISGFCKGNWIPPNKGPVTPPYGGVVMTIAY